MNSFFLFYFSALIYCDKFQIRQAHTELYLGRPANDIVFGQIGEADVFELQKSDEINMDTVHIASKDNLVLTVHPDGRLIYSINDFGRNQKFALQIKPGNVFKIVSALDKCLSFKNELIIETCNESENQNFVYIPLENRLGSMNTVPVSRIRLESLKRAALECDEIKDQMGAEAIAEMGETEDETANRLTSRSLL